MKTILVSLLTILFSLNISAKVRNPRIKLTVTLENFVKSTSEGLNIYYDVTDRYKNFDYIYGCTVGDVNQSPCPRQRAYSRLGDTLVIHPDLNSASYEYLAKIMIQGMKQMILESDSY